MPPSPSGLGPVDTGAGTLAAAQKYLEGRWDLLSFEMHPRGRDVIQVKGEGTLLFDRFGNLEKRLPSLTSMATSRPRRVSRAQ